MREDLTKTNNYDQTILPSFLAAPALLASRYLFRGS